MPPPQGLKVVLDVHGKPRHSVRGIVVHRKHLYVAGEAGNVVKVYELKTGRLRGLVAHQEVLLGNAGVAFAKGARTRWAAIAQIACGGIPPASRCAIT